MGGRRGVEDSARRKEAGRWRRIPPSFLPEGVETIQQCGVSHLPWGLRSSGLACECPRSDLGHSKPKERHRAIPISPRNRMIRSIVAILLAMPDPRYRPPAGKNYHGRHIPTTEAPRHLSQEAPVSRHTGHRRWAVGVRQRGPPLRSEYPSRRGIHYTEPAVEEERSDGSHDARSGRSRHRAARAV